MRYRLLSGIKNDFILKFSLFVVIFVYFQQIFMGKYKTEKVVLKVRISGVNTFKRSLFGFFIFYFFYFLFCFRKMIFYPPKKISFCCVRHALMRRVCVLCSSPGFFFFSIIFFLILLIYVV